MLVIKSGFVLQEPRKEVFSGSVPGKNKMAAMDFRGLSPNAPEEPAPATSEAPQEGHDSFPIGNEGENYGGDDQHEPAEPGAPVHGGTAAGSKPRDTARPGRALTTFVSSDAFKTGNGGDFYDFFMGAVDYAPNPDGASQGVPADLRGKSARQKDFVSELCHRTLPDFSLVSAWVFSRNCSPGALRKRAGTGDFPEGIPGRVSACMP